MKKEIVETKREIVKGQNPTLVTLRKKAETLLKKWANPVVKTAEDFEKAGAGAKDFVSLRKELKAYLDPEIKAAKANYDEKRNAFKSVDSIIEKGEDGLRLALEDYNERHKKAQEVRIEKALSEGKDERAATLAAKPYTPTVEGMSFTERWHCEVRDFQALLTAILDGRVSSEAVSPNMVYLNGEARTKKGEFAIPGCEAVKETSSSIRA